MMATTVGQTPVKEQVVDRPPKKFKAMKFGIQSNQDIVNQGVLEVSDNMLYDVDRGRQTFPHGPLDPRLGTSSKTGKCDTCKLPLQECSGHFGHVRLPLPVFHIGYLKYIQTVLQNICKNCSRVLLTETERRHYLKELRKPGIDNMKRVAIAKKINEQCRKVKECMYCGDIQGTIRKLSVLKLAHDKFSSYNKSTAAKKVAPSSKISFDASFEQAKKNIPDLERHTRKAMDDLNPLKVLNLFKAISPTDCELLGLNPTEGRPEMFLWQYVPAPPICIRPSVAQEGASTEDDITSKLAEIVLYCGYLRESLNHGASLQVIMEQWEFLQCQVAMYVNSDVPGLYQPGYGKPIRGFCQRLKGKQGRFRGNLSGKRVDFSGRTVISPDPNLGIDQVAVPILVAKNMSYPERVQRQNKEKLQNCVRNGPKVWPGAKTIIKKDSGFKINLEFANREDAAKLLSYGDVVERHLEDNDVVLFNRQPSLHKLSIMSHLAKIRPWRTFRLNECVCTPYNADFDGDEMNLHVPQTEEARAEAINLMGVKHNLATPKNGEPIIAATQDFITAAYLLSSKDRFYDRKTFTYICMQMLAGERIHLKLPPPAILKPQAMWTGKQIFSIMIRANDESPVLLNLDAKCREYKAGDDGDHPPDMNPKDAWLVIRNSEVLCGRMDKSTVGGGKKDSVFYVILRDWGPDHAVVAMNRLARLCARTLTLRGFSIGVGDVFPTHSLNLHKEKLVKAAYEKSDVLIDEFNQGKLEKAAGCNLEQTLENKVSGILSKVRTEAGEYCVDNLSRNNAPLIMARSGSKGSDINVAQMVACVGQQIIGGSRVQDGFQDRSLPHFHKNARQPPSKGFVKNSFYSGLVPTEFIFHAMSGREGLVDTAVKTAETGYMSRRLMKSLEDLSTRYDDTVRTSGGDIVQFQFGADNLDPVDMEGSAVPVHFPRTWTHSENLARAEDPSRENYGKGLLPREVVEYCSQRLSHQRSLYKRKHLVTGEVMDYADETDFGTDEFEGARAFLDTIDKYVQERARDLARARKLAGLDPCAPPDGFPLLQKKENDWADDTMRWKKKILHKQNWEKARAKDKSENTKKIKAAEEEEKRQKVAKGEKVEEPEPPKDNRPKPKPKRVWDDHFTYDSNAMDIDVDYEGQQAHMDRVARISENTLKRFIDTCLHKHKKSQVEPGHAVGAVGAQSIGEPGTQMTLKTFHFAGVAGMSITQGVPRIKEIINASKTISTPVITCPLLNPFAIEAARIVKGRVEKTFISDVVTFVEDEWQSDIAKINLKIDTKALTDMHLGITLHDIKESILKAKKLKMKIDSGDIQVQQDRIEVLVRSSWQDVTAAKKMAKVRAAAAEKGTSFAGAMDESHDLQLRVNFLKRLLPLVPISGYPDATRAIIQSSADNKHTVLVEGYGFRACMTTEGVDGIFCKTNSVMECRDVLGIEAARTTIAFEITEVMKDMNIDPRHMQLLADVMTYKGEILGITRFGLSKMRDSVLQLSSFERTSDHLFDAAANMKVDTIEGVSECIIMGQTMTVGTGSFQMVRRLGIHESKLQPKATVFEDAWRKNDIETRKLKMDRRRSGMNGIGSSANTLLAAAA